MVKPPPVGAVEIGPSHSLECLTSRDVMRVDYKHDSEFVFTYLSFL